MLPSLIESAININITVCPHKAVVDLFPIWPVGNLLQIEQSELVSNERTEEFALMFTFTFTWGAEAYFLFIK